MATFYSDLRTKERAARTGLSGGILNGDDKAGVLLITTAIYTIAGTEAAADVIELVDAMPGMVLVPQLSDLCCADPGTTLTGTVGDDGSGGLDTADADRYALTITASAGGRFPFVPTGTATHPAAVADPYRAQDVNKIRFTIASAATLTAGVKLVFTLAFRMKQ